MKKKLMFCIDQMTRGGTELQLSGILHRLDTEKYEIWLLTLKKCENNLVPDYVKQLNWSINKMISLNGLLKWIQLILILRKEKFVIVQTYFQDSTFFACTAAWLARVPKRIICFRDMGFWITRKQLLAMRFVARIATGFLANAKVVKDQFSSLLKQPEEKFTVIYNGIDTSKFTLKSKLSGRVDNIVIVGNMTRRVKRIDLFIKSAAEVSKSHPNIRWHIVGEGCFLPEMKTLAQELAIDDKIVFAGTIKDIPEYLQNMDIGVNCSDSEGLSNAIIEYLLCGLPIVATDVGGTREISTLASNMFMLAAPNNQHSLVKCLKRSIDQFGRMEAIDLSSYFSWETAVSRQENIID